VIKPTLTDSSALPGNTIVAQRTTTREILSVILQTPEAMSKTKTTGSIGICNFATHKQANKITSENCCRMRYTAETYLYPQMTGQIRTERIFHNDD
jgi:hypothetical protein